jgi:hypothetical protein
LRIPRAEIVRRRLLAQAIASSPHGRAEDVVARLGSVQAQDYRGALWAVGLRLTEARESDVERALAEGSPSSTTFVPFPPPERSAAPDGLPRFNVTRAFSGGRPGSLSPHVRNVVSL